VLERSPAIVRDPLSDPRCQDMRDGLVALRTKPFVTVPLILNGNVIGVIGVDRIGERFDFTDDDVELLTVFADLAGFPFVICRDYSTMVISWE
jgi:GAF domain-containing protein